jgi:hypothetical protein
MFGSIAKLLLAATAMAQVKYKFDDEEFLLNRAVADTDLAKPDSIYETTSNYFKTFKLMHKFLNEKSWEERSQVVVGYDQKGNLVEATVKSPPAELKDKFE